MLEVSPCAVHAAVLYRRVLPRPVEQVLDAVTDCRSCSVVLVLYRGLRWRR